MKQLWIPLAVLAIATALGGFLIVPAVEATTYLVKPDGSGDYPSIQAALDAAGTGDLIELASGTFSGEGNRDLRFHGKALTVRSQGSDPVSCVIDCGGSAGSPHRGFVFDSAETASSVLEGVTIIHGTITGFPAGRGGGIYCYDSSPTIRRCALTQNAADAGGGGICCANLAAPSLIECTITGNHGGNGGAIACWGTGDGVHGPSPAFTDCVISLNVANGAGGAVYLTQAGGAQFLRCTFNGNSAGYGGAGSFHLAGTEPSFTSCTFYDNPCTISGGTIRLGDSAAPSFDHCIIAGASYGSAVDCMTAGSAPAFSCCDIFGNAGGDWTACVSTQSGQNGNISADPQFCNPGAANFTIRDVSLCAEANSACGLIGVAGVGCSNTPTMRMTWGRLKSSFRG